MLRIAFTSKDKENLERLLQIQYKVNYSKTGFARIEFLEEMLADAKEEADVAIRKAMAQ